jgi:carbon storage regulator
MLVLTRKLGETVVLPDLDISVTILDVGNGKVRVGISAPSTVRIHRQEVWERIQAAAHEAKGPPPLGAKPAPAYSSGYRSPRPPQQV